MVIRSSSLLFKIQSNWRVPPHLVFSRKVSDRNYKMAICCRKNFDKSSFDWKSKGQVHFFIVKDDWRATNLSSHAHYFPKNIQSKFLDILRFRVIGGWIPPPPFENLIKSFKNPNENANDIRNSININTKINNGKEYNISNASCSNDRVLKTKTDRKAQVSNFPYTVEIKTLPLPYMINTLSKNTLFSFCCGFFTI